ncbi:Aminodeoxyfutalosine deaminase [Posidoniimonas polymericola]|uniref:Aminodeoxyfutalosine deaminase n=1 Tax=Posidoniimonas polymericola TaxID=2528002 RepID=A0A5C5YM35_9BACT|nr:amidohydrolase family protein [Posidoniimonas polymericola]TWT75879.1 Aminodeoxyfutalosine deaminase [Posidoniimonas polymericola]
MSAIALRARVVYPVVAPPVEGGVVVVENGKIVEIGRRAPAGAVEQDLGDMLLLPGLVNAHTHLEFSSLKKRLGKPGLSLPEWVRLVIAQRPTSRQVDKAVSAGIQQSIQAGVTTIADICRLPSNAYGDAAVCPRAVLMQESIGYSQARAASALSAAKQGLDELDAASRRPDDRVSLGVSPHAPYTVSPHLIRELVSLASERKLPVALHLAESPEELELMNSGTGPFQELLEERSMWDPWSVSRGATPQDYLRILNLAPHALVVHGNYLDHAALAMMGRHSDSMSLVYCPRTHSYFKHQEYPLADALTLGVRVCLGSDSLASSQDLSILSEMREVAAKHPAVSPEAILRMATHAGAEALGVNDRAGSIRPGAPADMVAVRVPGGIDGRANSLLESVLNDDQPIAHCWIGGQSVA